MEDNTRVLACRIDEKLQQQMKQHIANEGKTVKDYITGLIEQDLKTHSFGVNSKENLDNPQEDAKNEKIEEVVVQEKQEEVIKEKLAKVDKKDKLKEELGQKKDSKEKQEDKSKKEEPKKLPSAIEKKVELNKKAKKIQKEEEEEFE